MTDTKKCIFYFLGQLGLMFQLRFFFQWILDFHNQVELDFNTFLTPSVVGVFLLIFRTADAILDPMIGNLSDILVGKGRKRTSLMKIGLPLISIGLILSFYDSTGKSNAAQLTFLLISFSTFFVGYTLYCIPFWALIEDMSIRNNRLAESLSTVLGLGIFVASAISFVCTPILIARFGYFSSSVFICVISLVLMTMPFLLDLKESHHNAAPRDADLRLSLKRLLIPMNNKSFVFVIVLLGAIQASFTILTAIASSFVELVIGRDKTFTSHIMAPVIIVGVATFYFLRRLLNKYNAFSIARFFVLAQGLLFMLCYPVYSYIDKEYYLLSYAILFGFFGMPVAIILGIEAYLVKTVTPDSSYAGIYFGCFNFLIKTINGFAIMVTGFILSYTSHHNSYLIPVFLSVCGFLIVVACLSLRRIKTSF